MALRDILKRKHASIPEKISHIATLERIPTEKSGYGGATEVRNDPWLKCSCGHKQRLYDSSKYELARLNHLVAVLARQAGIEI